MIKNILIILLFCNFSIRAQKYQELSLRKIKKQYISNRLDPNIIDFYGLTKNEFSKQTNSLISIIISRYPPENTFFFSKCFSYIFNRI
jgi:hypothetical protein